MDRVFEKEFRDMKNNNSPSLVLKKSALALSVACVMVGILLPTNIVNGAIPQAAVGIYKQPTQGQTTVLLMLDTTVNMDDNYGDTNRKGQNIPENKPRLASGMRPAGSIYLDYPECRNTVLQYLPSNLADLVYGKQGTNTVTAANANSTFPPNPGFPYCGEALTDGEKALTASSSATAIEAFKLKVKGDKTLGISGFKYSRMDRMKIAMSLLLSDSSVDSKVSLGLGQFSTATRSNYSPTLNQTNSAWPPNQYSSKWMADNRLTGNSQGNDLSGKILIPNKQNSSSQQALDNNQRFLMRAAVGVMGSGGKTPLASALAEAGAYMLGNTTLNADGTSPGASMIFSGNTYTPSGFKDSVSTSKSGNGVNERYISPIPNSVDTCNASGIFLLSNGIPTETPKATAEGLMKNALNDRAFSCPSDNVNGLIKAVSSGGADYGWTCMGAFAKKLFDNSPQVKVAVAGFGNNFIPYMTPNMSKPIINSNGISKTYYKCNALTTGTYTHENQSFTVTNSNLQDVKNACNLGEKLISDNDINQGGVVGGYGQGGFYPIVSPADLSNSIKNFVADLETDLPALNTGLPAIPVDTLNSTQNLPYAYYAQFQPDTSASGAVGIWLGNIKKYKILNSTYVDKFGNQVVDPVNGNLNSTTDFWNTGSADEKSATNGGALSHLPVQAEVGRKIYTNRVVDRNAGSATDLTISTAGTDLTLINSDNSSVSTSTAESLRASKDLDKAYLLNLLGFSVDPSNIPENLNGAPELRQMGATLNSTPLFFTTKSKIATRVTTRTENEQSVTYQIGDYIDRKDYVLFGTNQGLLQVVNANTGEEKFSFLPKEMIDRQKKGFAVKTKNMNIPDLYAGIDGAWSVYANYVSDSESNSLKASILNVYGGLRRGGSNYYGLDFGSIETETGSPKILFKVGPSQTASGILNGVCNNSNPLNCMGQSWSKPTIAWVKWKGKPQLVMIVGGGYDEAYDDATYKSNSTATKGNGVYIFAANSNTSTGLAAGDLLWWGSSTASSTTATNNNTSQKTNHASLKYSVVSEIKSIDRDSDGFVDNLYFGDLGGQVFRVDINNAASTTDRNMVVKRITRIANFITDTDRAFKAAPRFYFPPTFTVHRKEDMSDVIGGATRYAVISIGSGDASSPVNNSLDTTNGTPDRVYGIFDRDIGRVDLYSMTNDTDSASNTNGLKTGTASTTNMIDLAVTSAVTMANMNSNAYKGWYNTLSGATFGRTGNNIDSSLSGGIARYKVLSSLAAVKGTLFTSYFDAADVGSSTPCSAGIKGRSYIKNYCLPFGSMGSDGNNCGTTTDGRQFSTATGMGSDIGAGVLPVVMGGMTDTAGNKFIGPVTGVGNSTGVKAQYKTPLKLSPLKWSEKNS